MDLHNAASELESSISLDEIAGNSHLLKGKRVRLARKAGRVAPEDGAGSHIMNLKER